MEEEKIRRSYTAPQLTVVTFKTERGYASSGEMKLTNELNNLMFLFDAGDASQNVSQYTYDDSWASNDWN